MDLHNIYTSNLVDNAYKSNAYNMTKFNSKTKRLHKAQYLKDTKEKLNEFRKILNKESQSNERPNPHEKRYLESFGFDNYNEYEKYIKTENLIYDIEVWKSYKRFLELECYINDILNEAHEMAKSKPPFDAICYLIDKQFYYHIGVLDEQKADFVFSDEYNQFIYDVLQLKINEFAKIDVSPIQDFSDKIKKSLSWNSKKTALGTIFGVLHKEKLIKGSKADIVRALNSMFGISESTLLDNVKLKKNTNEQKYLYDREVVKNITPLVSYLKKHTPKE